MSHENEMLPDLTRLAPGEVSGVMLIGENGETRTTAGELAKPLTPGVLFELVPVPRAAAELEPSRAA